MEKVEESAGRVGIGRSGVVVASTVEPPRPQWQGLFREPVLPPQDKENEETDV